MLEAQKLSAYLDAYKTTFSFHVQIFDFSYPLKTTTSKNIGKTCNLTTKRDFWIKLLFSCNIQ